MSACGCVGVGRLRLLCARHRSALDDELAWGGAAWGREFRVRTTEARERTWRAAYALRAGRMRALDDEAVVLRCALKAALDLSNDYASLLNDYDGGHRRAFAADEWLAWLVRLQPGSRP